MRKEIIRKSITIPELNTIPERDNRVFSVQCTEDNLFNIERNFMRKRNLRKYIDQPHISRIKLSVCDIKRG